MVLVNIAFAGATEVAQDIGMDYFQMWTAKLSTRIAQGIGGLPVARLGRESNGTLSSVSISIKTKNQNCQHIQQGTISVRVDIARVKIKFTKGANLMEIEVIYQHMILLLSTSLRDYVHKDQEEQGLTELVAKQLNVPKVWLVYRLDKVIRFVNSSVKC